MGAGDSAYDMARRQREKAARLEQSAARWERGAQGEAEVARVLAGLPAAWTVFHDLAWPGRPRANIDHVVVGPGGVFVIDAKNWSGRVEVRDQVLRQNGRRRDATVGSAGEAAEALGMQVKDKCTGVVCFVSDEAITGTPGGVVVCSTANLTHMLTSRPYVLEPQAVRRVAELLRTVNTAAVRAAPKRPATAARGPRGRSRTRQSPVWSLVRFVVAAVLMLALISSGQFSRVGEWVGEHWVERISSPSPPAQQPRQ